MKWRAASCLMTVMISVSIIVVVPVRALIAEGFLFNTVDAAEEDGKIALTPVQNAVSRLMRTWTLLDTIQAVQSVSWEHMTLFAREVVEEILKVHTMIEILLKDSEVITDIETLSYLSDLVGKIDRVQLEVFAQGQLDDIVCLRVIMQVLQKKLLLALAYQQ